MSRLSRTLVGLCASVLVIGAAAVVSNVGYASDDQVPATRVLAQVAATPTPVPTPRPVLNTGPPPCPQMTNPGGGIVWNPSSNAGPWATGGSVALPSLGVQAPVVKVGVGTSNEMVVPRNARDVAWLDQGPFPGRTNNAVLAGHIAYARRAGTFNRIGSLRAGDPVVVDMDGKRWEFRVAWVCSFHRDTDLADQIMGATDVTSVTLITCGGTFDRRARTHTNRIVARAELVSVS